MSGVCVRVYVCVYVCVCVSGVCVREWSVCACVCEGEYTEPRECVIELLRNWRYRLSIKM